MSRSNNLAVLIILMISCLLGNNLAAQEFSIIDHPAVASRLRFLSSWIEAHIAYDGWPGLSVGIVYDQELIWSHGYGYADIEAGTPVDGNTLYAIASNTKMFTAIAILKLRDEGKLQLDDPIEKYLPWVGRIQNPFPDSEPITIRDVLTHSSGLPKEAASTNWTEFYSPSLEEIIAKLPEQSVTWPPDIRWRYSNFGVSLLGAVVAAVAGTTYEEYITSNILTPLGMNSTGFPTDAKPVEHMATGYGRRMPGCTRDRMPVCDTRAYAAAAALWSSVNDLARFASWQFRLLNTGKTEIVKASTLYDMQQVHMLDSSWVYGWGLGFLVYHKEPCDLVGHGGWMPGHRTDFTVSPAEKIGVIALANADDIKVYPDEAKSVGDRVFSWVVPALRDAIAGTPAGEVDTTLQKYEGKYRCWERDTEILNMIGGLIMISPLDPADPDHCPKLIPVGNNIFRIESSESWSDPGEIVVFEENEAGEIVRCKFCGSVMEKIPNW